MHRALTVVEVIRCLPGSFKQRLGPVEFAAAHEQHGESLFGLQSREDIDTVVGIEGAPDPADPLGQVTAEFPEWEEVRRQS